MKPWSPWYILNQYNCIIMLFLDRRRSFTGIVWFHKIFVAKWDFSLDSRSVYVYMEKLDKNITINLKRSWYRVMQILVILRNGKLGVRILVCCWGFSHLCNSKSAIWQQQTSSLWTAWKKYYGSPQISQKLGVRWESVGSACGLLESAC